METKRKGNMKDSAKDGERLHRFCFCLHGDFLLSSIASDEDKHCSGSGDRQRKWQQRERKGDDGECLSDEIE
ncbi:hypothetical protein AAZX31_18G136200 [Glycine max]